MKATMLLQKSIFSKANKRLIFFSCLTILFAFEACNAATEKEETIQEAKRRALAGKDGPLKAIVDSIVVFKHKREMHVFGKRKKLKTYIISLGTRPQGKKRNQGDYKTPEGKYTINDRNPNSIYHKNLGISYPNNEDRAYARQYGLQTGGDVKIHGLPNKPAHKQEAYLNSDWTWGCIAVSNAEIDELYRYVATGAPIVIFP